MTVNVPSLTLPLPLLLSLPPPPLLLSPPPPPPPPLVCLTYQRADPVSSCVLAGCLLVSDARRQSHQPTVSREAVEEEEEEEEIYEADVESTQLELDSRSSQEVADDDVEVGSRAQV